MREESDNIEIEIQKLEHAALRINGADLTSMTDVFPIMASLTGFQGVPKAFVTQANRIQKMIETAILGETPMDSAVVKIREGLEKIIVSLRKNKPATDDGAISNIASVVETPKKPSRDADEMDLLKRFVSTQQMQLDDFEAYVLEMDKGNPAAKEEIRRYLHTLKGEFGVLDLSEYSELIHVVEDSFQNNSFAVDGLLKLKDFLISRFPSMSAGDAQRVREQDYRALGIDLDPPAKTPTAQQSASEVGNAPVPSQTSSVPVAPTVPTAGTPSSAPRSGILNDPSFFVDFIQESREHIHNVEVSLLELESNPGSEEGLHTIFRACHTVKGLAGFLELTDIQSLAHSVEAMMDQARNHRIVLTPGHVDALLAAMDLFKELILGVEKALRGEHSDRPAHYDELLARLKSLDDTSPEPLTVKPTERMGEILVQSGLVSPVKVDEALEKQKHGDTRKIGEILIVDENISARSVGQALGAQVQAKQQAQQQSQMQGVEESVRVPVTRLDQLIDAIGEAVIAQSMIVADTVINDLDEPASVESRDSLRRKVARAELIMRQIQELSMSLRMVSIKAVFQKMNRLVRDLSKKLEKNVDLILEGESTELDKTVVENIGDPLVHMVRNSMDHGIETPAERIKNGKPEQARLVLRAFHKAGSVHIEIQDDGRGLDRDRILAKAYEKGILPHGANPPDAEVWKLIFAPGFSTAQVVTDVSGRGVGMDVVRKNIESLRGVIDIQSEKNKGTTFTLRLPLTLAIIDGMVVRLGKERYIVPTLSIITTVRPQAEQMSTVVGKGEILNLRGELIRLVRLQNIFNEGLEHQEAESSHSVFDGVVLVVEDAMGKKAGILVDEILDQQQVVIKSMGGGMRDIPGVTGGAIMNDGTVSLILDIGALVKKSATE